MSIETVPIPAADRTTLFPPNRVHKFFTLADEAPFDFSASQFSWINAWWLAESALLSYDDPEHVQSWFERAGFALHGVQPLHGNGSTQCYVAVNNDAVIVAFRGTEVLLRSSSRGFAGKGIDVVRDLVVNAEIGVHVLAENCWAHSGFARGLEEVLETQLLPFLDRYAIGRTVWLTGHSLGGALATMAAYRLPRIAGIYTFGAPRVGNAGFAQALNGPLWRFCNELDIVPTIPPAQPDPRMRWIPAGYVHCGEPVHFEGDMANFHARADEEPPALLNEVVSAVSEPMTTWDRFRAAFEEDGAATFVSLSPTTAQWQSVKQGFVNHAPLFYALKVRNALARTSSGG